MIRRLRPDLILPSRSLLTLGRFLVNLLYVLSGVFLEVFDAVLTAELDLPSLVDIHDRFTHLAQFLAGNNTSLERVRFGFGLGLLVACKTGQGSSKCRDCQDGS